MNSHINICENTNQLTISIVFMIMFLLGYVTMSFINKTIDKEDNTDTRELREMNNEIFTKEDAEFFMN